MKLEQTEKEQPTIPAMQLQYGTKPTVAETIMA